MIDDEVRLTKALEQLLAKNGYAVQVFQDGRRALECLTRQSSTQNSVDLVITDIYMDHMDGLEIIRALKESFPTVKIIVMSGGSELVELDCLSMAKLIGADRALAKPVQIDVLLKAINELEAELTVQRPLQERLKSIAALKNSLR
ncbi:MAG TPA: response regulator [Verrucomicrobiae bacterium]|nr:response regulator [Verrucomicrobiae bacterium]